MEKGRGGTSQVRGALSYNSIVSNGDTNKNTATNLPCSLSFKTLHFRELVEEDVLCCS